MRPRSGRNSVQPVSRTRSCSPSSSQRQSEGGAAGAAAKNAVLLAADVPTPVQNQFSETAAAALDSTAVTLIACALPFPSGLTSNSTLAANQELPNRHQQENAHLLASLQQYSVADISRMAEDILPASVGCQW